MSTGEIRALNAQDGRKIWSTLLGGKGRADLISRLTDVTVGPVVTPRTLLVSHANGNVTALSTSNGFRLWQAQIDNATALLPSGNTLLVSNRDGMVVAFNISNGSAIWDVKASKSPITHLMQLAGKIGALDAKGKLIIINPNSGETESRQRIASKAVTDILLLEETTLIMDINGKLTARN